MATDTSAVKYFVSILHASPCSETEGSGWSRCPSTRSRSVFFPDPLGPANTSPEIPSTEDPIFPVEGMSGESVRMRGVSSKSSTSPDIPSRTPAPLPPLSHGPNGPQNQKSPEVNQIEDVAQASFRRSFEPSGSKTSLCWLQRAKPHPRFGISLVPRNPSANKGFCSGRGLAPA